MVSLTELKGPCCYSEKLIDQDDYHLSIGQMFRCFSDPLGITSQSILDWRIEPVASALCVECLSHTVIKSMKQLLTAPLVVITTEHYCTCVNAHMLR